tara:strand:+ start:434 stop:1096 length:663 start_codon:yes stop_codon:yes gene_type:complete
MKILAIEFSSEQRSAAVLDGSRLLAEQTVSAGRNTEAIRLIESALTQAQTGRQDIECIAVGVGPGSYTGIRTAIAITQGWQIAAEVKVQSIDSLEALAFGQQAMGERGDITFAVDAARGEFYIAKFELEDEGIKTLEHTHLVKRREFEHLLNSESIIIGPSLEKNFSAANDRYPAAKYVGIIASLRANFTEASELEPVYLRKHDFVKAPPLRDIPPLLEI